MSNFLIKNLILVLLVSGLAGCGHATLHDDEEFVYTERENNVFEATPRELLRAAKNTALNNQYLVMSEDLSRNTVRVIKTNPLDDDLYAGLTIEMSTAYASKDVSRLRLVASEVQYRVTKNTETAVFLSIPLPTGETQSVIEIRKEMVVKESFYKSLLDAVKRQIGTAKLEIAYEDAELKENSNNNIRQQELVRNEVKKQFESKEQVKPREQTEQLVRDQSREKPAVPETKKVAKASSNEALVVNTQAVNDF